MSTPTGSDSFWGTVRVALGLLTRGERWRWSLLVPLELGAATMEAVAAAMTYVLIAFVTAGNSALPGKAQRVISLLGVEGDAQGYSASAAQSEEILLRLILLAIVLFAAKTLLRVGLLVLQIRLVAEDRSRLAVRFFRGYLEVPYQFHLAHAPTDVLHRILNTADNALPNVLFHLTRLLATIGTLLTLLVVVVVASLPMATAMGLFVALWVFGFSRATKRLLARAGDWIDGFARERLNTVTEGLQALRELKVLGRHDRYWKRFRELRRNTVRVQFRESLVLMLPRHFFEGLFVLGLLLLCLFAVRFRIQSTVELVALLGLYTYCGVRSLPLVNGLLDSIGVVRRESAPVARLYRDLEEIQQLHERFPSSPQAHPPTRRLEFESLEVRGVTFRFPGSDVPALDSIDFAFERGETVGIVGRIGAGKSTFFSILAGLLQPNDGEISVNGSPLQDVLEPWQRTLGICWQNGVVVRGTLRRNIALGLPDEEIDDDAVRLAIDRAHAGGFVDSLPRGLETPVGEGGRALSGGERCLLFLIRALYTDPQVLLLDEPTASVDKTTEERIVAALARLAEERTLVIVSHRPTTLVDCDRVLTLRNGRLEPEAQTQDVPALDATAV